jgi:hypothetical protein
MLTTRGDATRRDALAGMSNPSNRFSDSDRPGGAGWFAYRAATGPSGKARMMGLDVITSSTIR